MTVTQMARSPFSPHSCLKGKKKPIDLRDDNKFPHLFRVLPFVCLFSLCKMRILQSRRWRKQNGLNRKSNFRLKCIDALRITYFLSGYLFSHLVLSLWMSLSKYFVRGWRRDKREREGQRRKVVDGYILRKCKGWCLSTRKKTKLKGWTKIIYHNNSGCYTKVFSTNT